MLRPQHVEQKQPYVDDSCELLLHFNGQSGTQQFIDSSNIPKVVTAYGNACLSNTHYRFGGTSGYFDGNSDYLEISTTSDFDFGSNLFTISFWIYPTTSQRMFFLRHVNSSPTGWALYWEQPSSYVEFYFLNNGTPTMSLKASSHNPTLNTWNYYNISRISSNTFYMYYGTSSNPSVIASQTSSAVCPQASYPLKISNSVQDYSVAGYIDEVAIFNGVYKSPSELMYATRPYGYPIGGT